MYGQYRQEVMAHEAAWNAAGTFEERDVSAWAADRLRSMLELLEAEESDIVLEQCEAPNVQGTATIFAARGKTKSLFELQFEVQFKVLVRATGATLCEGSLACAASNEGGAPELQSANAFLRTQVPSRDHHMRVVNAAQGSLKDEVERAVQRFAAELAKKGLSG